MADEDVGVLASLPGWTVEESVATFAPLAHGWRAVVRHIPVPGKRYRVWHVVLLRPSGAAEYARTMPFLGDARRLAEGLVRAQQPA
jgi:hypothetical protein